jgi:hypothetical protein
MSIAIVLAAALSLTPSGQPTWGFFAHKKINRIAVFTLPADMVDFFKANLEYLEEASVYPDRRRYAVPDEAARHYLDVDYYGDSVFATLPRSWAEAVARFGAESLEEHGVLPWNLFRMFLKLRDVFTVGDPREILRVAAEIGHYVGDAHVPLHTTLNYNGQLTGQRGIHGLWESRLPELFSEEFDLFTGPAEYLADPQESIWRAVLSAHRLVDRVLEEEAALARRFGEKRYAFETRGNTTVRVYAKEYARAYHLHLTLMVEQQFRLSIKLTGDLWYTAWVDAGQPDLAKLIDYRPTEEELIERRKQMEAWSTRRYQARDHE